MADYQEPPDRGLNRNDGVPEANGFTHSNHSSPHATPAQITPPETGNYYQGFERNSDGLDMPMPINHQHTRSYSGGSTGGYPPPPMPRPHQPPPPLHHHQPHPEQWKYSQSRQPQHMAMPMPQAFPPPQPAYPPYPPQSMGAYPPMGGPPSGGPPSSQGYPSPYPPRSQPPGPYHSPPQPEHSSPKYPPAQPQEPTSPYPPVHLEPHSPYPPMQQEPQSPYPPLHQEPTSPYLPMHQHEPPSPYPPVHQQPPEPASPYPPMHPDQPPPYPLESNPPYPPLHQKESLAPYPPPHQHQQQQPYPPLPPRVPLHQENMFPQRAATAFAFRMPAPERWTRTQTYHQAAPYPPLDYMKPPAQDFISTYRPSTVQPSTARAADAHHRESMRKSLHRADSSKHHADSDDSSDESDIEQEDVKEEEDYLSSKPLPPAPSVAAPAAATAPASIPSESAQEETVPAEGSTDPALLSVLSKAFAMKMKEVVSLRELSCSTEYRDAFTGFEAVDTVFELLGGQYPREHCLKVLNAMMQCKPAGLLEAVTEASQKSSYRRVVYDSPDETYRLRSVTPVGVFTGIAKCYVHGCEPGYGGCYAPRCPNKPTVYEKDVEAQESLGRSASMRSSIIYTEGMRTTENWGMRVSPEFHESVEPRERDRQEAMNEVIYGEEQYLKDLEILHEAIVGPLSESDAIEPDMWPLFARDVFNNYQEVEKVSSDLFEDLYERQQEYDQECMPGIADILLKHFERFTEPYARYVPNVHLAEYIVALSRRSNDRFSQFLQSLQSNPQLNRQTFRHFLLRPVMRLQRYPLLLSAIIKKTDEDHEDYETLQKCKEIIGGVAALCDQLSVNVKNRVEILTLNSALTCRQGEFYDLKLTDPQRKIYFRGDLKRDNSTLEVSEKYIHVVVLDHLVLLTKARKTSENTEYKIWRQPIPLQMLYIQGVTNEFTLPSLLSSRTSTMHSTYTSIRSQTTTRGQIPSLSLTLVHPGRHGGTYYLLCSNPEEKKEWLSAVRLAKENLKGQVDAFGPINIDSSFFRREYEAVTTTEGPGKVTCSVPFVSAKGSQKVAIGTTAGVYFKTVGGGRPRTILSLKNVMQVGVMQKYQILLVLADKELHAYPLDVLDDPKNIKAPDHFKHVISDPVHFFQVGVCNGEDMLVYARQKTVSTIFTACKPARDPNASSTSRGYLRSHRSLFSTHGSKSSWFSTYREFSVGARATNIHFLKSKFAVVCERAFEIIDPEDLVDGHTIPDEQDPQFDFLEKRRDGLRPLAMYRVQGKFLMCYNKFAFYVNNRNQQLVPRDETSELLCEFESHPDNIVYQHPYVLAFDQRFIEIRHVETGDLVQMIPGNDCRLTYYNGNGNTGEPLVIEGCIVRADQANYQSIFRLQMNPDVQTKT
ncbi:CNH domain-containing protein [Zychaea mexicana]|uniref:CNH domain-containing protein n=1 Tax=Zychaea mexicana TaxID=64656 RepID=UPI0022FEA134|nr:CNH domain-containing protein [Zychaea mexicana]KAI9493891.1 CNH domain-containing protein [Zychaea mexicana]